MVVRHLEYFVLLLPHLFSVATDPNLKEVPGSGHFRSSAVAWIYRHVFLSILVDERNCSLQFTNGLAAWLVLGNARSTDGFVGDVGTLAVRVSLGDPMLQGVLTVSDENGRHTRVATVSRPRDLSRNDVLHLDRMVREALPGVENASEWFANDNVSEAARVIVDWAKGQPHAHPVSEIEIGSHRPGGRGTTITI